MDVVSGHDEYVEAYASYTNYDGDHNIGFIIVKDKEKKEFLWTNTASNKE